MNSQTQKYFCASLQSEQNEAIEKMQTFAFPLSGSKGPKGTL
jgi:hypothetical protein